MNWGETRCLERDGACGVIQHGYEILELTITGRLAIKRSSVLLLTPFSPAIHSVELVTPEGASRLRRLR